MTKTPTLPPKLTSRLRMQMHETAVHCALRRLNERAMRLPEFVSIVRALPRTMQPALFITNTTHEIALTLSLYKLRSFKDERLLKLLSAFPDDMGAATNDYASENFADRAYTFTKQLRAPLSLLSKDDRALLCKEYRIGGPDPALMTTLRFTVYARVKPGGKACRTVCVGEKLVQRVEKQYEIRCD